MANLPVFNWKPDGIVHLIEKRSSLDYLFSGNRGSSTNAWKAVAENLACGPTAYQCKKKWENLQAKYKTIVDPPTGVGLEEQTHGAHGWPYFDSMNRFMSNRHTIKPPFIIQSSAQSRSSSVVSQRGQITSTALSMDSSSVSTDYFDPSIDETSSSLSPSSATKLTLTSPPYSSTLSRQPPSYNQPYSAQHCPSDLQDSLSNSNESSCYTSTPSCSSFEPFQSYVNHYEQSSSSSSCSTYNSAQSPNRQEHCEVVKPPIKKRRVASKNKDSLAELVTIIKEDTLDQQRQREEARRIELDLLEMLREFLAKK